MNERIKELAEQAGFTVDKTTQGYEIWTDEGWHTSPLIERFAELVRQDEREQISHTYLKLTLEAVLREREACAKLCDDLHNCEPEPRPDDCAAAIRARSKHE